MKEMRGLGRAPKAYGIDAPEEKYKKIQQWPKRRHRNVIIFIFLNFYTPGCRHSGRQKQKLKAKSRVTRGLVLRRDQQMFRWSRWSYNTAAEQRYAAKGKTCLEGLQ